MKWNNVFYCVLLICANAQPFSASQVHDGSLDVSFGPAGTGFVDTFVRIGANAVTPAVQADGKIVVLVEGGVLVRYNSNGTLDTSFGINGIVVNTTGISVEPIGLNVLIQPDGKIIIVGTDAAGLNFQVVRYNSNGTLDESFGAGGVVVGPSGNTVSSVALQVDNKIVVTGSNSSTTLFNIVRYDTDGSIDTVFESGPGAIAANLTIQNDGAIVVVGYNLSNISTLVRYNADGTLDTSYIGTHTLNGVWSTIVLQPDGKVIIGGESSTGAVFLARFDTNGVLDTTFGGGLVAVPALDGILDALLLQADGKIIGVGNPADFSPNFALVRYTANGTLDTSFGVKGVVEGPAAHEVFGGGLQANGKILAVGLDTTDTLALTARYINNSPLTPTQICGIKKRCNGVHLWGTAQNPSIVSIFRNGVFIGGTTTDPKGSNTWTFTSPYKDGCYGVAARYPNGNVNTVFERMWLKSYINYGS